VGGQWDQTHLCLDRHWSDCRLDSISGLLQERVGPFSRDWVFDRERWESRRGSATGPGGLKPAEAAADPVAAGGQRLGGLHAAAEVVSRHFSVSRGPQPVAQEQSCGGTK